MAPGYFLPWSGGPLCSSDRCIRSKEENAISVPLLGAWLWELSGRLRMGTLSGGHLRAPSGWALVQLVLEGLSFAFFMGRGEGSRLPSGENMRSVSFCLLSTETSQKSTEFTAPPPQVFVPFSLCHWLNGTQPRTLFT